jgi:uncharacterized protein with NRDE domain
MCLTYFTIFPTDDLKDKYRFILAFNRDEQTLRKTLPLGPFEEDPNIIAGRDLVSGGTWLGINVKIGVIVILTNYNVNAPKLGQSRGKLVYHFLSTNTYTDKESVDDVITSYL